MTLGRRRLARLACSAALCLPYLARESPVRADDPAQVEVVAGCAVVERTRLLLLRGARIRGVHGRWSIRADRIEIRRGHLRATGRVVLRPCGAASGPALLAERASLTRGRLGLRQARFRYLGLTTPAIPWLELVPESRVGFLAPELSLRRDLGLVVGSGVHLPLAPGHGLDLRARTGTAGGGAEASIDGSAARVRALLSVRRGARSIATLRGRGAARQGALAVAADVGLLRGPRSAMGAESNERLSEVEDVVAAAAIAGPSTHAGSALELWRPASAGAFSWVAPRAVAGASWSVAGLALEASSEVEADRSGAAWLRPALRVGLSGSAGPLRLSSTASAEARVDGRDGPPGRAVLAGAAARVSLRRTFGEQVHRIVPLVGIGAAGWVRPDASSAGRAVEPLPRGAGILAVAGLSSSLSHLGATWAAADLFVRWPVLSSPEPSALHAVLSLRAPAIQARAAAAWPLSAVGHETGSALPALVSARLSIGPAASRARLDLGLLHTDWRGRSLAIADAREPAPQGASSIARGPVTLVGAELRSPWLGPLAAALGLDVDVAAGELTRVRGELALRDGCLTLTLAGAWALPDDAPTLTLALGGL